MCLTSSGGRGLQQHCMVVNAILNSGIHTGCYSLIMDRLENQNLKISTPQIAPYFIKIQSAVQLVKAAPSQTRPLDNHSIITAIDLSGSYMFVQLISSTKVVVLSDRTNVGQVKTDLARKKSQKLGSSSVMFLNLP